MQREPRCMRARSPHAFKGKNKIKNKKYGRQRLTGAGDATLPGSMRGEEPSCFFYFIYFLFFCLRRPADRCWTTARSRTLTSRKMLNAFFRSFCFAILFFVASQYSFHLFCLRRPADRRWTAARSRTLTSRKMLSAFFRSFISLFHSAQRKKKFPFFALDTEKMIFILFQVKVVLYAGEAPKSRKDMFPPFFPHHRLFPPPPCRTLSLPRLKQRISHTETNSAAQV